MKFNSQNKLKMLKAVQYTLLTNSDITSTFANEVGKYDEYLQKIRELSQKINKMENGTTSDDLETSIRNATQKMASAVLAYAAMTGRIDLMTNEHIKVKTIENASGRDLYSNSLKILEIVKENQMNLNLFGVNDSKVKDYENIVFYFGKLSEQGQSVSRGDVEGVCEEAVRFLEDTIDNLVEQEKSNYPKFYNEYQHARSSTEEQVQNNLYFFA